MKKQTLIGIALFFIIGLLVGSQLHGCKATMGTKVVSVKSDTLIRFIPRTDTLWKTIELTNNVPYTVWGHDTVYLRRTEHITGHDTAWLTAYQMSTDTAVYIDTLRQKDAFKAELYDTLYNNRIIGRAVKWADLAPIELKTISTTTTLMKKQSPVKVYIGADAYGGHTGTGYNFDMAPEASLVISDRYMLDLGYYIFNRELTAGVKVKLSFRK